MWLSSTVPSWLYWPIKGLMLIGFMLPFILWGAQLTGISGSQPAAAATQTPSPLNEPRHGLTASPSPPAAQRVAAPENPALVHGIDVSHFQGEVDWRRVARAGVRFAYAKATGGAGFVDPRFALNWQGSREAGLHRGAYHFFLADDEPVEQARLYLRTVGKLRASDLPPMLDVETDDHTSIETLQRRALTWLQEVEKATGRRPIVYTDNGFADSVLTDPRFARYAFWIADYADQVNEVPSPWEKRGWVFWQFTETGRIDGVPGDVDRDKFNGSHEELRTFIRKSHVR